MGWLCFCSCVLSWVCGFGICLGFDFELAGFALYMPCYWFWLVICDYWLGSFDCCCYYFELGLWGFWWMLVLYLHYLYDLLLVLDFVWLVLDFCISLCLVWLCLLFLGAFDFDFSIWLCFVICGLGFGVYWCFLIFLGWIYDCLTVMLDYQFWIACWCLYLAG